LAAHFQIWVSSERVVKFCVISVVWPPCIRRSEKRTESLLYIMVYHAYAILRMAAAIFSKLMTCLYRGYASVCFTGCVRVPVWLRWHVVAYRCRCVEHAVQSAMKRQLNGQNTEVTSINTTTTRRLHHMSLLN